MFRTGPRSRTRLPLAVRAVVAAGIALSGLSLTACSDGTGTRDEGAATLVAQTSAKHSTVPHPATNRRTADSRKPVTCTGDTMKVKVTEVSRPLNHLLITATNTGTRPCHAYNAPYLRFDDARSAVGVNRDSMPQAVVTLQPGESVYAGVTTSAGDGSGTDGRTTHSLGLYFSNRATDGSVGPEVTVGLPAGGVYVDGSATTTYWQATREDALSW
ncbi:DUF4232 domain-containing protein [Streptomyces sp. NPDC093510]|uniref:DUF4232 domain-containing protein n=1 Tax=Streptomyces sp. NPDC093510 TaxID=3155199 RepID=UPI00342DDF60